MDSELIDHWTIVQQEIKQKFQNSHPDKNFLSKIRYIGGLDISFFHDNKWNKGYEDRGYVGIVVVDIRKNMQIVYEECNKVILTQPYVPSFLAFREIEHYKKLLENMKNNKDPKIRQVYPDIIIVDGNGILHPRSCGIATHLGVELNIPTIGCAKTVYAIDGITANSVAKLAERLVKVGEYTNLKGKTGKIWGSVLKTFSSAPIFGNGEKSKDYYYVQHDDEDEINSSMSDVVIVSEGNLLDLNTAIEVLLLFSNVNIDKIPYPVYLADSKTREKVRRDKLEEKRNRKMKK